MTRRTRPGYVIGVDPGARWTGLVLRRGDAGDVVGHRVVDARAVGVPETTGPHLPGGSAYLAAILDVLDNYLEQAAAYRDVVVAVEDVHAPSPHLGMIAVRDLIGAAVTLGVVIGAVGGGARVVRVPPGGHGSNPLAAYPPRLRGPRETNLAGVGTGVLRHARSAYDVAGVAGFHADPPFGALPSHVATR